MGNRGVWLFGKAVLFRGSSSLSLDSKGRMAIPAKYRDRLQEACSGQLVVTIDQSRCLLIYPLSAWEEVEQKLEQLSSTNQKARELKRLLLGYAEDCVMDNQGRILLPAHLREFARLDKKVVLAGQGNKFELWNAEAWDQLANRWVDELDQGELSADLASLSF